MSTSEKLLTEIGSACPTLEIQTETEDRKPFAKDEAYESANLPEAILLPTQTEEVSRILELATHARTPVIPRGAGTGLSGAAVPLSPSLILSLQRMNQIVEISQEDSVVVAQPGVITGDIRRAAEVQGLFYPPIPASVDSCTIGGNIATNAGGLCAVKYGVTREYVLALEVVLPTGEVIHTGGRYVKNSTGYNLTQLMIGSEGTLGVITNITLRLLPLPKERFTLLAPFDRLEDVTRTVVAILGQRVIPPTLELLPRAAVECVHQRHPDHPFPFVGKTASLLIELDGRDSSSLENQVSALQSVLAENGAGDPVVATSPKQRDEIWGVRKLVRDSIANSGDYVEADSVVPRRQVPALVNAAEKVSQETGLPVICYGHAGDGNLHTYFRRGDLAKDPWEKRAPQALTRFFEETIALGGTLSGEHGIGFLKRDYLPMALSQTEINLMRRLKHAFDPQNILNPGKVFPASLG